MEQKQELEANSEYYWNSQTGDFKQVINARWLSVMDTADST